MSFQFILIVSSSTSTPSPLTMSHQNHCNDISHDDDDDLPKVLLHVPPKFSSDIQRHLSHKFHFLNQYSLPLHQFMATQQAHHPSSITALICYGHDHPVTTDTLRSLPSLRFIFTPSSGTDHIDLSECRRRGAQVAGAGNTYSEDVADMAVGLLIDVVMKISVVDRYLRSVRPPLLDFSHGSKV